MSPLNLFAAELSIGTPSTDENKAIFPVMLTLDDGETIAGINLEITHSTTLTYQTTESSQALVALEKIVAANAPVPGTVRIVIYDMENINIPSGHLANISFDASQAVDGNTTVTLSYTKAVASNNLAQEVTLVHSSTFSNTLSNLETTETKATSNDDSECFIGALRRVSIPK